MGRLENADIGSAVQDAPENAGYVEAEMSGGELVTWAVAAEGTSHRATSGQLGLLPQPTACITDVLWSWGSPLVGRHRLRVRSGSMAAQPMSGAAPHQTSISLALIRTSGSSRRPREHRPSSARNRLISSSQRAAAQASRWEKIVARDATRGRLSGRRPH
jgi:hypothetical protein